MISLFERVGFSGEYRTEYTDFYRQFFNNEEDLNAFFTQVFINDDTDKVPRRMMNQVQRFVSLSNDIEQIRPSRDSLKIVFLRTCIESLCKLACKNNQRQESENKRNFLSKYLETEEIQYILDNFVFTGLIPNENMDEKEQMLFDTKRNYALTIDDFGMIMFKVRGMVVHEGDYWSMQFFSRDSEYDWLTDVKTDEEMIACYKPEKGKPVTYCFETRLNYNKFIKCFVNACIRYMQNYINNNNTKY